MCLNKNGSTEAFAKQDVKLAKSVPEQDDVVDNLYQRVHREVTSAISVDPNRVAQVIYLSHIGHHLERVGDRVTNICEWVVFAVTGEKKELNVNQLPVLNI